MRLGLLYVQWEEWAATAAPFDGPGLTVAIDYGDRQPRPMERLDPERARQLRDYLNSLPLD